MNQKTELDLNTRLKNNPKTYITLKEIREILDKEIEYIEFVNIIKKFISDGILKTVRKRKEWQNSIAFFKIQNNKICKAKNKL